MSSTYLTLVNNILTSFNEVNLTTGTFATAVGFHADVKRAVTTSVFEIYTFEDVAWPFLWNDFNFVTTVGVQEYTKDTTVTSVSWGSFAIKRPVLSAFTLTQAAGTAVFTTLTPHYLLTGDTVIITGATPDGFNTPSAQVTVTSATTFEYSVSSSLSSPASGTIVAKTTNIGRRKLKLIDYDYWLNTYADNDADLNATGYGIPCFVVRKPNNDFILSTIPNRSYTINYKGFVLPSTMVNATDTALIPTEFDQVILDKAFHYAYMFRDNIEQATLAETRYQDNVHKMRRILIPQSEYMKHD